MVVVVGFFFFGLLYCFPVTTHDVSLHVTVMTPCFPPLCSVSCASQLPVFSLLFICPVRGLQLFPASMQCTIRVAATSFLLLLFFLLFFFRFFNFPACHGFQLFPAKTVGVGISLTVNGIKLLYTFFFFRVMQGVAWFISVLVIGINMFFVAEYVVSCDTSLPPPTLLSP